MLSRRACRPFGSHAAFTVRPELLCMFLSVLLEEESELENGAIGSLGAGL